MSATSADVVTAVTGGAQSVVDTVVSAATAVLPVAAIVIGLLVAWRFARRLISG